MLGTKTDPKVYGLVAEFDSPEAVLAAARRAHAEGYRDMDAYTPFPVHGLSDAIGFKRTKLPLIVLLGGLTGAVGGFSMQYFSAVIHYPINVGGRPMNSWPAFIIPTFEMTILFAALSAVLGMLALNGLPQPYHPLFNVPSFDMASTDAFFLCIEGTDPKFDPNTTRRFLEETGAGAVRVVPNGRVRPPKVPFAPALPTIPGLTPAARPQALEVR